MGEKKKPGRFTIQFSMGDPQQRAVAEILDEKGRRKAQFITNAVLQYTESKPEAHGTALAGIDEKLLEQMVLSVIQKSPQIEAAVRRSSIQAAVPPEPDTSASWEDADSESALAAISNTLNAFKRG